MSNSNTNKKYLVSVKEELCYVFYVLYKKEEKIYYSTLNPFGTEDVLNASRFSCSNNAYEFANNLDNRWIVKMVETNLKIS